MYGMGRVVSCGSYKRVEGRSHGVENEPADAHKTSMQPVSHHYSPTHTASLHMWCPASCTDVIGSVTPC